MVDCVYIAASTLDARFTRICVASVRRFHPQIPIRLLVGGRLQGNLAAELKRYWAVEVADIPNRDYGWGFVKLEPLFGPPGERFLILDSDTVMTGPVLEIATRHSEDFIVDDECPSPEEAKAIYYDSEKAFEEGNRVAPPAFLFNTGEWFGRSGVLSRRDFDGLVQWGWPPKVIDPRVFKNGEQGILNFVVNEQFRAGKIRVARVPLMRWPGHGMHGLESAKVSAQMAVPGIVHWAGMKKLRQRDMVGADLLSYFERMYYRGVPGGRERRIIAIGQDILTHWREWVSIRARLVFGESASG